MDHRTCAGWRHRRAAFCAACVVLAVAGCRLPVDAPARRARLSALRVSGAEGRYPAFDPAVLHYAARCADGTTLQVAAEAEANDATLRLLHDGSTGTGSAHASVTVNSGHDVAVEVSDRGAAATYVVHCIPPDFPDIAIETHAAAVSEGLLLITPGARRSDQSFLAIVDTNGVPRWVMRMEVHARNFRRHRDGRYSFSARAEGAEPTVILNAEFDRIDTVTLAGELDPQYTGGLDFLIMENGNYLLMSYYPAVRDLSAFTCSDAGMSRRCSTMERADDSIIQELTPAGEQVLLWNSWDHVKMTDCTAHRFPNDYAHLNSLHELEGDVVVGLRGCAQVLRIERATGAVVWQLGGSEPMRADRAAPSAGTARYLPVTGDPLGEFCGQHQVTVTPAGSMLMFDNGDHCLGPRKAATPVSRIVEYDIASGTEAHFVREYRLPAADGFAVAGGGVTALDNGNWLVTWGNNGRALAVSEVDTAGKEIFRLSMAKDGEPYITARVYREPESVLGIPLNLP